ncbi:MAG: hypothetical protein SWY16_07225 [Cyanobacteriota bacterium]|nr:hypothetical protein [Cyanobacteriota bacterium]
MGLRPLSFLSSIAFLLTLSSGSLGIATRAESRNLSSSETSLARLLKSSVSQSEDSRRSPQGKIEIAQDETQTDPPQSEPESTPTDPNPTPAEPAEVVPAPEASSPVNSAILLQEEGKLEEGDPTFESDGSLYDAYTFVGRAGQSISIDLQSEEFDTYLLLVDAQGNKVGENDDTAEGNTNSKLDIVLESNSIYTIVVNGFDSQHKGAYTLTAITQLGTGDLQATLTWDSTDDLDLTILDPNEQLVSFETPLVDSGGKLDVDANALCESTTTTPVENIFWPSSAAPTGSYAIAVSLYSRCPNAEAQTATKDPIPFTLTLTVQGTTETFTGTVDEQNSFVTFPTAVY